MIGGERVVEHPAAGFLAWFVAFGVLAATLPAAEMTPWFYLLGAVIGASVELVTR